MGNHVSTADAMEQGSAPPTPTPPVVKKGRIRRLMHAIGSVTETFMLWASAIGSVVMLGYQILYSWGFWSQWATRFPEEWSGTSAWIVAFIMAFAYLASKMFHIIGQQPGDWPGLIREVYLGQVNIIAAVAFLACAYSGRSHPESAIGITYMLLVLFNGLMIWQLSSAMRLAVRTGTWTDQPPQ